MTLPDSRIEEPGVRQNFDALSKRADKLQAAVDALTPTPFRHVEAQRTAATIASSGTAADITFDTQVYDSGALFTPGSATVITADVAGVYELAASVSWGGNVTGIRRMLIRVRDTSAGTDTFPAYDSLDPDDASSMYASCSCTHFLDVGDSMHVQQMQSSGINLNVSANASGTLIGSP